MIWTDSFLNSVRNFFLTSIVKAQAEIDGGERIDLETIEKSVSGNAFKMIVKVPAGNSYTIQAVHLLDSSSATVGTISDGVNKTVDDEFYMVLEFPVYEV